MYLHEDGSMDVREVIDVNFTESSRGIYRTIPFYGPSGRYTIIEDLRAIGGPASSYTEGNYYNLRIGDPNIYLIGDKTYTIAYRVKNAIAGFEEGSSQRTELYWNIIGPERTTTIDQVNFTVHLPKETTFFADDYYVLYGKLGEKKTWQSQISLADSSTIIGSIDTRLQVNEGATIGVRFPTDYFSLSEEYWAIHPPVTHNSYSIYYDRSGAPVDIGLLINIFIVFGITIGLIVFSSMQTRQKYKSNRPITIYYTPPKNIDIILASEIYEVASFRTLSSLIYDWATKGYLTMSAQQTKIFRTTSTSYTLIRKHTPTGLHETLMEKFFAEQTTLSLSRVDYSRFEKLKTALDAGVASTKLQYYTIERRHFLKLIPYTVEILNEQGIQLYEELRGFAHYLEHVEEPRLKQMLKEDPNYIDKVLPRAVLFGVETKFLKAVEQIIGELKNPDWYSGNVAFSIATMHTFSSQVQSSATPSSSGS